MEVAHLIQREELEDQVVEVLEEQVVEIQLQQAQMVQLTLAVEEVVQPFQLQRVVVQVDLVL